MFKKYKNKLKKEYKIGVKYFSLAKSGYMGESKPEYNPLRKRKIEKSVF